MQEKLILIMERNSITIREIANLLGITDKQASFKIKGKSKFNGDEMFKIADYFKLHIEDIFLPTYHQIGE